ncbi:MAG: peptidase M14 [Allomuricauda sp.]|nr:MAG: peptidase M14 [Allomuricauda sp.]
MMLFLMLSIFAGGQNSEAQLLDSIHLTALEPGKVHRFWLQIGEDEFNNPIKVPVLVAKGAHEGQTLGLTAAIHGNEVNGIAIIHNLFHTMDISKLKGTVLAIPGLNPQGISRQQREFMDGQDLNRIFPGKAKGNRSEQMAHQISQKIIPLFDYHVDLHTASFGRINTLYGRGDMDDKTLAQMLRSLQPDIIVSNKGNPSFGSSKAMTMRAFAISKGVHSITMEYGNPQVFQNEMIERGSKGLIDLLISLKFLNGETSEEKRPIVCSKSYWLFTDKGGWLEVLVDLNQELSEGQDIAILRNAFGEVLETYKSPEAGIVIGKSTNPVNLNGGRIIHLGIVKK